MTGRLSRFRARGFKSLHDVDVQLAPFTVLFGPNAVGKSNLLEAMTLLAGMAAERTFADAVQRGLRGQIAELFEFPDGGLPALLRQQRAHFELGPDFEDVELNGSDPGHPLRLRYHVGVAGSLRTGELGLDDERLSILTSAGVESKSQKARIERQDDVVLVRHRSEQGRPNRQLAVGSPFAVLADGQIGGDRYPEIEAVRRQLQGWEFLYLEPRHAMREPHGPRHVTGIGPSGEWIAPFLLGLEDRRPQDLAQVRRLLQRIIPSVEDLQVGLDDRRGLVDVTVVQDGTPYSLRVLSEGTLRVLALACVVANPTRGRLITFEEPENGVHPARLDVIEELLHRLSEHQQVIVTTHSPHFTAAAAKRQRADPDSTLLLQVTRRSRQTLIRPFDSAGALFGDAELRLQPETEPDALQALLCESWRDA